MDRWRGSVRHLLGLQRPVRVVRVGPIAVEVVHADIELWMNHRDARAVVFALLPSHGRRQDAPEPLEQHHDLVESVLC